MKDRLAEVVDEVVITGQNTEEKMCSCESDVVDETCSSECYDACGDCLLAKQETFILCGLAVVHIAELTGKSERAIKRQTIEMQEKGLIYRENGKRNGRWKVLVEL